MLLTRAGNGSAANQRLASETGRDVMLSKAEDLGDYYGEEKEDEK